MNWGRYLSMSFNRNASWAACRTRRIATSSLIIVKTAVQRANRPELEATSTMVINRKLATDSVAHATQAPYGPGIADT